MFKDEWRDIDRKSALVYMVRIPGFHPGGPGSIPGCGTFLIILTNNKEYSISIRFFTVGAIGLSFFIPFISFLCATKNLCHYIQHSNQAHQAYHYIYKDLECCTLFCALFVIDQGHWHDSYIDIEEPPSEIIVKKSHISNNKSYIAFDQEDEESWDCNIAW